MDLFLFQQINSFAGRYIWLDALAIFFAEYAEYVLLGTLPIFLLVATKKYWPMVWQGLAAAILSRFVITEIIRWLWERPRPFVENEVYLLVDKVNQASFPSGHAAFYFGLSAVVFAYHKKAGFLFFIASVFITLSRIFVGVHWSSDILAGAVVGLSSAWIVLRLFRK